MRTALSGTCRRANDERIGKVRVRIATLAGPLREGNGAARPFAQRAASIAIAQGRRPVQWSEVYDHFKSSLPKETVVHVWKDVTNVTEVVADGYDVIRNVGYVSVSWYLDNLEVGLSSFPISRGWPRAATTGGVRRADGVPSVGCPVPSMIGFRRPV